MSLEIYREILSTSSAGTSKNLLLIGVMEKDGSFTYAETYLAWEKARPISFSLPLRKEPYSESEALPYFAGLLPEGKALSSLAMRLGKAENDYLGLLETCGLDCVGDIIICPKDYIGSRRYRKTTLANLEKTFSKSSGESSANLFVGRRAHPGVARRGKTPGNKRIRRSLLHSRQARRRCHRTPKRSQRSLSRQLGTIASVSEGQTSA